MASVVSKLLPSHKDYLMLCLIRCERLIISACVTLDPNDFDSTTEKDMAILWAISLDFYRQNSQLCPRTVMQLEVDRRLSGDSSLAGNLFLRTKLTEVMDMVYAATDTEIVPAVGMDLLQTFLDERKVRPLMNMAASGGYLPSMVEQIHNTYVKNRLTNVDSINPFDLTRPELETVTPPGMPTTFLPLDLMLNGGPRRGDVIGVLGPTSGGKTMIGIMSGLATASSWNEHVMYCSYEEAVEPKMRERMWVASTNLERKRFEGKKLSELDSEAFEKLRAVGANVQKFRMLDMSGKDGNGMGGMNEVEASIQKEIMYGRRPCAAIIDWVGDMATKQMTKDGKTDPHLKTGYINMICSQAKTLAGKYNMWVMLLQQLNATAGSGATESLINAYQAADCKMFPTLTTACLTISPKDADSSLCRISNPKARCGGDGSVWVKIDNVHHRMQVMDNEYTKVTTGRRGEGMLVPKSELNDSRLTDIGSLSILRPPAMAPASSGPPAALVTGFTNAVK
jgi:hypothetical protein